MNDERLTIKNGERIVNNAQWIMNYDEWTTINE